MIYAIGDSFTEGAELPGHGEWGQPSPYAWPTLLAKKLNQEITNLGRSACGNTRIIKRAIDTVYKDAVGIIICWTSPIRIEMIDSAGIYDIWPGRPISWLADNPDKQHRLELKKYLNLYHSNDVNWLYNYKNFLRQIILIQNLCQNNNIKCSMFIAFGAKEDANMFHHELAVQNLLKYIDLSMFVDNTMEESISEWIYGTNLLPRGHPDVEGHKIIAEKVFNDILKKWY